ncbi:MAG: ABC transporter ATP-binding protein [Caldibacillus debilis]|jgi:oligopeptide transport system ATP-binding protein|uniref:Oligopeptide/dipeptide ABC transporter, ATP-binding protein, C-terminal domain n=2 Tax=Caldibacillus debilis TaxID=301148 RepID=A0A420VJU2_9BACI|nr:ABC transporter ATP-binding protein [Caldibacillus debilis]MBO2483084.1 ABC transporter ATP-binding protein [Bacillaceae bacterium]OUM91376.1 MAG: peptide ABC transporter ATP-binding protein [Caldibacillus debilis]REJ18466.1 MAG: ABC transporter ATP-binding protein [Caldibacillus debilis]REJ29855.1 MAG: ABC transporter ATP-binding protein [Caldibacillus debilis]REJ30856.1 MAG: ABC transporter ATP-binding protein [Caldibacillus debilis]
MEKILEIKDLEVKFHTQSGTVHALRGVNFHLNKGETLALVGESGSGKSVTAQAIMKLLPTPPAEITKGQIILDGEDIVPKTEKQMEKIRGNVVSMIFQDPMTSLNPTMRVGRQIDELIMKNEKVSRQEAKRRAIELLDMVGIPNAASRYNQYPHQFSGGMRQRVMIAIAVAARPKLLIADEPTTALDVTIQAQILELMKRLKEKLETSIIFITHDLGVVANMADRVAVMYAGQIVEIGTSDEIFYDPRHPYTWGLLSSIPSLDANDGEELHAIPGSPPDLTKPPVGDAFARRSPYALQIDFEKEPPMFQVSETHFVKSWLLHPNAPKVEPPKIVQQRRRVLPGTFEHPVLVEGGL